MFMSVEKNSKSQEFDLTKRQLGPNLRWVRDVSSDQLKKWDDEDSQFVIYLPSSTLGREGIAATGEIYKDIYDTFGLKRLDKIWQLGVIHFPGLVSLSRIPDLLETFSGQNRWQHSLLTGVLTEIILRNNNQEEVSINNGIAAGLLHNSASTPFSDLISGIWPEYLNEGQNISAYLERFNKKTIAQKYGLDFALIEQAVRKQGKLGRVVDIADKLSYIAFDSICAFVMTQIGEMYDKPHGFSSITQILKENPTLFDIFQSVRITGDLVYFENPDKLSQVLKLRAYLYRDLYYNPECLKTQAVIRAVLSPLVRSKKITLEQLIEETDLSVYSKWIYPLAPDHASVATSLHSLHCGDKGNNLKVAIEEISNEGGDIFYTEKVPQFDPKTSYLVRNKQGEIRPFSEVYPEQTYELEKISKQTSGWVVYYFDN